MRIKALILSVILTITLVLNTTLITYAQPAEETTAASVAENGETSGSSEAATGSDTENGTQTDTKQPSSAPVASDGLPWPLAPTLAAGSAILIDADTGAILYEKNSHDIAYPASTTKLMTALLTIENCSLTETVTFSYEAAHSVTWEDANIATKEGEQYTVEQCLYALLLPSANEVAYGLAEHISGSLSAFTQLMNERAQQLGALNTHFNNASGLNDPEHYTTAYDLAMIGRAVMNNTTIINIMNTLSYTLPATNLTNEERNLNQRHSMLKPGTYYYEYCVGGKTGFTDESGYTLVSFAKKDNMNLIAVVLQCAEPEDRYIDTIALFEYGFNNFEKVSLSNEGTSSLLNNTDYFNSKVFANSSVSFSLDSTYVVVPTGTDCNDVELSIIRDATPSDAFGKVIFKYGNHEVGNADLTVVTSSITANSSIGTIPSNLPVLTDTDNNQLVLKEYMVIDAWQLITAIIVVTVLVLAFASVLFLTYTDYGKQLRRTRRRRNGYKKRNLKF